MINEIADNFEILKSKLMDVDKQWVYSDLEEFERKLSSPFIKKWVNTDSICDCSHTAFTHFHGESGDPKHCQLTGCGCKEFKLSSPSHSNTPAKRKGDSREMVVQTHQSSEFHHELDAYDLANPSQEGYPHFDSGTDQSRQPKEEN